MNLISRLPYTSSYPMFRISNQSRSFIRKALREDIGSGDITTKIFIPDGSVGEAYIEAKASGIVSGGAVVKEVFCLVDSHLKVDQRISDGRRVSKGKKIFRIRGRVSSILRGERVALNFLERLSGIATLTDQFVQKTKGTRAKILDTRKTTPLWRELEKYAVRTGGGENHRLGLWDEVLVKDNHWKAMRSHLERTKCRYFASRLENMRRKTPMELEVESIQELNHLLEGDFYFDRVLLDNFSVSELRRAVQIVRRKRPHLLIEASGGVALDNVRQIAKTGVDRVSVGAITHSAPALDFSLEIVPSK